MSIIYVLAVPKKKKSVSFKKLKLSKHAYLLKRNRRYCSWKKVSTHLPKFDDLRFLKFFNF